MPHLPEQFGTFPLILRDYDVIDPQRGELLMDYDTCELYLVKPTTGEIISIARNIYDKIIASRVQNTNLVIVEADKQDPPIGRDEIFPPIKDREYNSLYYVIRSRYTYIPTGEQSPLDAPAWSVKQGKKFFGKYSGYYVPDKKE